VRIDPGSPKNPPFRGRSALLIDHHTRSAAELMAHGYKRNAFGPVVGTPTAGAVSSGGLFVMPGDLLLYVATSSAEFDGQRLEGVGVPPITASSGRCPMRRAPTRCSMPPWSS
jgi:C-terminal processing protease CtpA/Prc